MNETFRSNEVTEAKSLPEENKITVNNMQVLRSYVTDMCVWENRLFVSLEDMIFICDVNDSSNPEILCRLDFIGSTIGKIIGNNELLYVFKRTDGKSLLDIFTINDPCNPSKLCELENITAPYFSRDYYYKNYEPLDVFQYTISEQRYLVYNMPSDQIRILNSSIPSNSYDFDILNAHDYLNYIVGIYLSVHLNDTSLFGLMWFDNQTESQISLVKYNVTDFSNPQIQMNLNGTMDNQIYSYFHRMSFHNDLLILTAIDDAYFYCFKLINNSELILLNNESLESSNKDKIVPYRNYLFTIKREQFQIYEVDNVGNISRIYTGNHDSDKLILENDIVYLARLRTSKGFTIDIFNASNPHNLTQLSYFRHWVQPTKDPKWSIYMTIISAPLAVVLSVGTIIIIRTKRKRKLSISDRKN